MIHKVVRNIHGVVAMVSRGFSFAGGMPSPEGTGERSSSGDFQERDIPVHACKSSLQLPCQIRKYIASQNKPHNNNTTQFRSSLFGNPILISAFLYVSGAVFLSSCSSVCSRSDIAVQVLDKEHQVLSDLKAETLDSEIVRRIGKDPVLKSRESRIRAAIEALIQSNSALRKAF